MNRILSFLFSIILLASCSNDPEVKYDLTIQQPFESIAPASDTLDVNPSEAQRLSISGGSSIDVPAWAFVDANGDTVKEAVKMIYKEMKNAADIVASGIPMTVQDSGKTRQMESAGMFELTAFAGNTPVFLGKDKKLRVNMASPVEGDDYDLYYLEPATAVASAGFMLQTNTTPPTTNYRWKKLYSPSEDSKAKDNGADDIKATGKKVSFAFNTTDYPETKILEDINWQLCDDEVEFDPESEENKEVKDVMWNKLTLSETDFRPKKIKEETGRIIYQGEHMFYESGLLLDDSVEFKVMDWNGKTLRFPNEKKLTLKEAQSEKDRLFAFGSDGALYEIKTPPALLKLEEKCSEFEMLDNGNMFLLSDLQDGNHKASLRLPNGKEIWNAVFPEVSEDKHLSTYAISVDKKHVAFISGKTIQVISQNGKLINSLNTDGDSPFWFIKLRKEAMVLSSRRGSMIWDFTTDKKYPFPADYNFPVSNTSMLFTEGASGRGEGSKNYLWDYENNSISFLNTDSTETFYHFDATFLPGGNLIFENILITPSGKAIRSDLSDVTYSKDKKTFLSMNGNSWRGGEKKFKLYSQTGQLLHDFIAFDPSIMWVEFVDDTVLSYNTSGTMIIWNSNGKLIRENKIPIPASAAIWMSYGSKENFIAVTNDHKPFFVSPDGKSCSIPRRTYYWNKALKNTIVYNKQRNAISLYSIFGKELPTSSFLAKFDAGENTFYSYLTLSEKDIDVYYQYRNAARKREEREKALEEERQKAESALIRSFEISNMGIYNWDRIYKDEDALIVKLNLKGELPKEYANATLFHITGMNSTTVIKYNLKSMDSFAVKLAEPNKLMLVLGDGRMGIVEDSVFRSQNVDALKRSKLLTVQLQVKDKPKDRKELAAMLKQD